MTPDLTYIVSAYHRPVALACCLWSIAGQSHPHFECIVTDNSQDSEIIAAHRLAVEQVGGLGIGQFRYVNTAHKIKVSDCYHSAQWAVDNRARGTWVCFPCDDCYYVPHFAATMLATAHQDALDMVMTEDIVLGPDMCDIGSYAVVRQGIGRSTKSSFIVRRSAFPGFSLVHHKGEAIHSGADRSLSVRMNDDGYKVGAARGCMVVHN